MMKRTFLVLMLGACPFLSGCSPNSAEAVTEKPAVVINQLKLTKEELKQELQTVPWSFHGPEQGADGEPEWLSRLIERELLVQEAQRLGLDRRADFMRTIERFWKEALIKLLLDRKMQEIADKIRSYEPEIEARYRQLQEESPDSSLEPVEEMRDEIQRSLREEKAAQAMEEWVAGLRAKSKITVDSKILEELK